MMLLKAGIGLSKPRIATGARDYMFVSFPEKSRRFYLTSLLNMLNSIPKEKVKGVCVNTARTLIQILAFPQSALGESESEKISRKFSGKKIRSRRTGK
jgi:hypothetical protein